MDGATIEQVLGNEFELRVIIDGPAETPYVGGRFMVKILYSPKNPFSLPEIKFVTKIYHLNIELNTGKIDY